MKKTFSLILAALFLQACASGGGGGTPIEPPKLGAMAVVITDSVSQLPVMGVLVTCSSIARGTTNEDGYLAFSERLNTQVDCTFSKEGFYDSTASLYLQQRSEACGGEACDTLRMWIAAIPPPKPLHPDPVVGRVRKCGDGFCDDRGPLNPSYAHAGDFFSLWTRGHVDRIKAQFAQLAAAGFHGLREWNALGGSYWAGYEIDPDTTPDYWSHLEAFARAAQEASLRFVFSQGDIGRIRDRRDFMTRAAALDNQLGGVIDFLDCGNEAWQTGEPDPRRLAECVGYHANAGGRGLKSLTSADGDPTFEDINRWSIPPADVFDVHSWRGGHSWDKRRHIWSYTYCGEGCPDLKSGINSEPPGNGTLVSVTENKHELDDEAVALLGIASALGRQAHVWFSGEGVKLDRGLEYESGFFSTPRAMRLLPRDVATYEESHHSGESWRHLRVLVAQGEVRIDGRQAHDGRFAYTIDGPPGTYQLQVARSFEGELCHPGTGECVAVSKNAGERLEVGFQRGRLLKGRVR